MKNFIILSLVIVCIGCGNKKSTPVLVLGKHLDEDSRIPNVTGSSDFSNSDNFAWILKQSQSFNFSKITMRFYKIESNGEKLVSSDELEVNPQHSCIYYTFPAKVLLSEYGDGKFEMQFLRGDEVLGSKTFTLSNNIERDSNSDDTEEKLSAEDLMNDQ